MKIKKLIFGLLISVITLWSSILFANYQATSADSEIVNLFVQKVQTIEQNKPWTIERLIIVLPILEKSFHNRWEFRFAYIVKELTNKLSWNDNNTNNYETNNEQIINRNKNNFQYIYEIGPGKKYTDLNQIPRESLQKSTLILIYYRDEPYKNKFVVNVAATENEPVVILWIADVNWNLPKIDWNGAITRQELDYRNEERSLIKIWWSSKPDESIKPSRIYIENLDIYGAKYGKSFNDDGWNNKNYSKNATCVHMEYGDHIFLKNNHIHNCSNGIFTTHFTDHIWIEWNKIYANWNVDDGYCHNTYTESQNIVYRNNFMWDLLAGSKWTNLKDRSAGTIIEFNWIEWWNRQLDLVETTHEELLQLPQYQETFVRGNILIEKRDEWNGQIMHYGGDGWDKSFYRNGKLYFYNNTVVSKRTNYTTLINLSLNEAKLLADNNIFYTSAGPKNFAISDGRWQISLENNLLPEQRKNTHNADFDGNINLKNNIVSMDPWFIDVNNNNYHLKSDSIANIPCKIVNSLWLEYNPDGNSRERNSCLNIGALEK